MMVQASQEKGLPLAYVAFEGEGHGFRSAEYIKTALPAQLYFYSRIYRFRPAGERVEAERENMHEGQGSNPRMPLSVLLIDSLRERTAPDPKARLRNLHDRSTQTKEWNRIGQVSQARGGS